ncbi:MAG: hypothetical protein KH138_10530 [Firmicutes bacterium]|nr:hypothetical protein [Bacillota bacterium]
MKQRLIVSLMLLSLLTLAACGTTQGDTTDSTDSSQTAADTTQDAQDTAQNDAQGDTQENAQNDTQEGSKDSSKNDGKIKPLPDALDLNHLTSGTVAASFDASSLKEVDGQLQLSFTVYNYEKFDAADISGLKAGDVLVVSGREMTVASVQASDGYVTVNGGEEAGGVLFSLDASSNTYYVMGMDDSKTYYEKGQLTFPVADTCVLTDDADFEHPGQTTPASDLPKLLTQDDIYGFDPQSTTVTLKNSQITAIYRGFLP